MNDPTPHQNNEQIAIQAAYANIYNEIVKPEKVFVATQYFRKRWVPRLNPNLAWLIIALRQHCYWNKKTDEMRDWCVVDQDELAKEIGLDARSIRRLLQKEHADKFILEVNVKRYRYDQRLGKRVRKKAFYRVRMDDPLTSEDEEALKQRLIEEMSSLNEDPETGQFDMHKLFDRPLTPITPDDLPDKMSSRSPEIGKKISSSDLPDKESTRFEQTDQEEVESDLPDKMSRRSTYRTKSPQYHIPDKESTRSDQLPDKESAILYTGQNVRNKNSTYIVPDSLKVQQQQQFTSADVVDRMAKFGVGEPALSKFKGKPPDQVLGWIAYAEEKDLGPGYVVSRLDADEWPPAPRPSPETTDIAEVSRAAREEAEALRQASLLAAGVQPEDLKAWATTLGQLKLEMTRATFDTWLKGTEPIRRENDTLVIGVERDQAIDWLNNRLRRSIERTAAQNGLTSILVFEVRHPA